MKFIKYITLGLFFGIVLSKGEIISWYRIYEMFRFDSFHMFGVIGSAVILGIAMVQFIKKQKLKDIHGNVIVFTPKNKSVSRYLFGGILFGLGWAMTGACPGPMYILIGKGYLLVLIILAGAILGTLLYGMLRKRLPH